MEKNFTWIPFYMEFADKLKTFADNRHELIELIKRVFKSLDVNIPTLEKKGSDIVDIDPFTVIGLFNKGITEHNRKQIVSEFKKELDIASDMPTDFNGIPILNNLQATFYGFGNDRGEHDIDNLWDFFFAALDYADNNTNEEKFCNLFDTVTNQYCVGFTSLTMALFWIRPYKFLNLDKNNQQFIRNNSYMPDFVVDFVKTEFIARKNFKARPTAKQYLKLCTICKQALDNGDYSYRDFPSLSYCAWLISCDSDNNTKYEDDTTRTSDLQDAHINESLDTDEDFDIYEFFNVGNTWLLAWNPKKSSWDSLNDEMYATRNGKGTYGRWNCANTDVELGDRIFIIKLGEKPRGIFATGYAVSKSYEAVHYDESKNTKINYIDVLLTEIEDYQDGDIILQDFLNEEFPEQNWSPQNSGIKIKPRVVAELIELWNNRKSEKDDVNEKYSRPRIWKISEGSNKNGVIDYYKEILENRNAVCVNESTGIVAKQKISQGDEYMYNMKIGEYFYLCYSSNIVLLGIICSSPIPMIEMNADDGYCGGWYERSYRIIKKLDSPIRYTNKKKIWTPNFNSTCIFVKEDEEELFEELILKPYFNMTLEELFSYSLDKPEIEKYKKEDFLKDVYLSEQDYTTLTSLMEHKKNIILQGAPGVGKTFAAKRLAYAMMGEKDESRTEFIQFHQNYSYEDFIMGYRPKDDTFELTEGVFYRFCERARNDSDRDYFFIIDEINRGNLSKIFGELLMLIEADKREKYSVTLAYRDEKFSVPDNLYIIGMMNTADRSLAMIDYALRRRFSFFEMKPGFDTEGFRKYADSLQNDTFDSLITQIKLLNADIAKDLGKGFCIGHSYFCNLSAETFTDERIRQIVDYDILPMLYEYWFDSEDKAENWKKKLYQAIGADYDE